MLLYQCWYIIELLLLSVFLSTNLHLAHRVPIAVDALERRRQGLIMQGGRHARVWRRRGGEYCLSAHLRLPLGINERSLHDSQTHLGGDRAHIFIIH